MGVLAVSDDYLLLFQELQTQNLNVSAILSMLILTVSRLFPIIALAPFFGARLLPHPIKVAFGISLFIMLLPQHMVTVETPLTFNAMMIFLVLKELLIGLIMGMLVNLPFWAAQVAGLFTDHQRGGASLMVQDPTIQSQSSPIGSLYNYVLIYLFFLADGPFLFIQAIFFSFEIIPIDQFMSPAFFTENSKLWQVTMDLLNKTLVLGVQLASPALLIILMTDMFLGIINRMAPQVMITFLGLPLKSLLAMAVIAFGWKLLAGQMVKEALIWLQELQGLVTDFGLGKV